DKQNPNKTTHTRTATAQRYHSQEMSLRKYILLCANYIAKPPDEIEFTLSSRRKKFLPAQYTAKKYHSLALSNSQNSVHTS
ncbi:hypothetical protein, partial [Thiolapillus sp.]|uniref:hypothetical protein n=1 Tax=Thiolapillus sp. TaxID=2017437 RepID=UPI003AF91F0C